MYVILKKNSFIGQTPGMVQIQHTQSKFILCSIGIGSITIPVPIPDYRQYRQSIFFTVKFSIRSQNLYFVVFVQVVQLYRFLYQTTDSKGSLYFYSQNMFFRNLELKLAFLRQTQRGHLHFQVSESIMEFNCPKKAIFPPNCRRNIAHSQDAHGNGFGNVGLKEQRENQSEILYVLKVVTIKRSKERDIGI